jgi:predicted O-methyltransferase YrrM
LRQTDAPCDAEEALTANVDFSPALAGSVGFKTMAWGDFRQAPLRYLASRTRLVIQLAWLVSTAPSRDRTKYSWPELIDFVFGFGDGFLRPLQVRSELLQVLEEIEKLKPRFVLEIGTAMGGTFFLLARAAANDALLVSLDLPGGRWGGGYSNWKTWIYRRFLLPGQSAGFVRKNSHDPASLHCVKELLGDDQLNLLFIDADHSYAGVKTDFESYSSLVRSDGLIVVHDIVKHSDASGCHVDQFWAEIRDRYPHQEIIEDRMQGWAGIGVLRNVSSANQPSARGWAPGSAG